MKGYLSFPHFNLLSMDFFFYKIYEHLIIVEIFFIRLYNRVNDTFLHFYAFFGPPSLQKLLAGKRMVFSAKEEYFSYYFMIFSQYS